jgi:hypothetical protein
MLDLHSFASPALVRGTMRWPDGPSRRWPRWRPTWSVGSVRPDQRIHGTTLEAPTVRFERDERAVLRPLPSRALPVRERRLRRRVALDAMAITGGAESRPRLVIRPEGPGCARLRPSLHTPSAGLPLFPFTDPEQVDRFFRAP